VDGVVRARNFVLTSLDAQGLAAEAAREARRLVARAGL
jgi:hypothetical protein